MKQYLRDLLRRLRGRGLACYFARPPRSTRGPCPLRLEVERLDDRILRPGHSGPRNKWRDFLWTDGKRSLADRSFMRQRKLLNKKRVFRVHFGRQAQ